jgi:hypothetical protein
MKKQTTSIIGIALGIAIIIIGICVMNPETYTVGDPFIKFGADFYTEMYDVTQEVGGAVQRAYVNICNAIGWLIVAIGLFDVAYFVCKMVSSEQDNYNGYTVAPSIATSTTSPSVQSNTYSVTQDSVRPAAADDWKCTCGKIHKNYESSCACGVAKHEAAARNK